MLDFLHGRSFILDTASALALWIKSLQQMSTGETSSVLKWPMCETDHLKSAQIELTFGIGVLHLNFSTPCM